MGEGRSRVHKNIRRNVPDCSLTTPPGPPLHKGGKDHAALDLVAHRKREACSNVARLSDLNRLEQLVDRVLDATSWDDLIGES
jgi:phosphoribosyl 1,2-cyclic phosphodiesterase